MHYQNMAVGALITNDNCLLVMFNNQTQELTIPTSMVKIDRTPHQTIGQMLRDELSVTNFSHVSDWRSQNDATGVLGFIYEVDLLQTWRVTKPEKYEWAEYKSLEWIKESDLNKSGMLQDVIRDIELGLIKL